MKRYGIILANISNKKEPLSAPFQGDETTLHLPAYFVYRMKYFLVILSLIFCNNGFGQTDTTTPLPQHLYGLYIRSGETIVHTVAVENIRGAKPFLVELETAKRNIDFNSWNKSGLFAATGFLLSYFKFHTTVLGSGAALSYFIRPTYRIGNRLTAYYQAGIGADYLTNPYSETNNPINRNYSQRINPYMHVGIGLGYQPAPHFIITANGFFHHTSNGEIRQPNKGINWRTAAIGLLYTPSDNYLPRYKRNRTIKYTSRKVTVDAGVAFTPKQGYYTQRNYQRTFIGGALLQFTKAFTNTNAFTAGISAHYNHYIAKKPNTVLENKNPVLFGVHAGHAFVLGKITFSQQIGVYLINPVATIPPVYEQWNLTYLFSRHIHAGVGLRANIDNADFTDIKLMYRF